MRIDGAAAQLDPDRSARWPRARAHGRRTRAGRGRGRRARRKQGGEFDHPELRPLGERCITSFGNNAGPPMLPNYFYNNNYTIVQGKDT